MTWFTLAQMCQALIEFLLLRSRPLVMSASVAAGVNGCSLKTEDNLKVVAAIPEDRLMIETDCPWCEIRPSHAGRTHVKTAHLSKDKKKHEETSLVKGRNEPCNLIQVLEAISGAPLAQSV